MTPKQNTGMEVEFNPEFLKKYRQSDVRIRHRVNDCLRTFKNNPADPELNNHALKREWTGFRSIDITSDYRAIFEYKQEDEETVAYFVALGAHKQLYR